MPLTEKIVIIDNKERFPVLLNEDGFPLFLANYYLLSMCRGQQDAFNTIRQKLRSIMCLYMWCDLNDIDIEHRFKSGNLLTITEIDSLHDFLKIRKNDIYTVYLQNYEESRSNHYSSKFKKLHSININYVSRNTYLIRSMYVSKYIEWLIIMLLQYIDRKSDMYLNTINPKNEMMKHFTARAKYHKKNSTCTSNKTFDKQVEQLIIEVIAPNSPSNPWREGFVKLRNQAFLLLALCSGLRRGEMLKLQLGDIDWVTKTASVVRRPDDPADKRKFEPNVKTQERIVPIQSEVIIHLYDYVKQRKKLKQAKFHPYIFVNRKGSALSYNSAGDIYLKLRSCVDGVPDTISQHSVRHTWNLRFSELMKGESLSQEAIDNYRKALMGWSKASKMPELYNKFFINSEASKISLKLQEQIFKRDANE